MEISFLSRNNVDGQHSRKHRRRHRHPWSRGRSFEQPPIEFVADCRAESCRRRQHRRWERYVSRFSENVNSYRCSARPKDPEWVSEWVSEWVGLTSPSTHYRSFRRRVFPVDHLHWYTNNLTKTTKRQNTQITFKKKTQKFVRPRWPYDMRPSARAE